MKKFMRAMTVCFIAVAVLGTVFYAVAAERDTAERKGEYVLLTAGGTIYAGEMVCVWSNNLAYVAADTASYAVVGRAEQTVASGSTVKVKRGIFRWATRAALT